MVSRDELQVKYIEGLKDLYSPDFVNLVERCLRGKRPNAAKLQVELQEIKCQVEKNYGGPVTLDMMRLNLMKKKNTKIEELERQNVW